MRAIAFIMLGLVMSGCSGGDAPLSSDDRTNGGVSAPATGVKGCVVTADKTPVEEALVQPSSLDTPLNAIPEMAVVTDQQGCYQWQLLPGTYTIAISAEGYRPAQGRITIKRSEVATLNFTLERTE